MLHQWLAETFPQTHPAAAEPASGLYDSNTHTHTHTHTHIQTHTGDGSTHPVVLTGPQERGTVCVSGLMYSYSEKTDGTVCLSFLAGGAADWEWSREGLPVRCPPHVSPVSSVCRCLVWLRCVCVCVKLPFLFCFVSVVKRKKDCALK